MNREQWLRLSPLLFMLLVVALISTGLFNRRQPENAPSPLLGKVFPDFAVQLIGADKSKFFTPASWRGNVIVFNTFASWCEPCAIEHPELMKLAESGQVSIVGLAWKDKVDNVVEYLNARGNPYQAIGLDTLGTTTVTLGLTGVPETFVIDKSGHVAFATKEPLTDEMVSKTLVPLIQSLQAAQ